MTDTDTYTHEHTEAESQEAIKVLVALLGENRGHLDAVVLVQELVSEEVAEDLVDNCPAMGCCGCGAWFADVRTPGWEGAPRGESYCWRCVDSPEHPLTTYTVLPGRERPL